MFRKVLSNPEDYNKLPLKEWKTFFELFDKLQFEKSICILESIFRKYPQLSSFKYHFIDKEFVYDKLDFQLYNNENRFLIFPDLEKELKNALFNHIKNPAVDAIYRQFSFIKREERFTLYKLVTCDIPEFQEVITAWEENNEIDYEKETYIYFQDISLPLRIVSSDQIITEQWYNTEKQFIAKNLDYALLKIQQFFWSVELLFKENPNLKILKLEKKLNEDLKISVDFYEPVSEHNKLKEMSFQRLNEVIDASNLLIGEDAVTINEDNRFSSYETMYDKIKEMPFAQRVLESIINIKNQN